MLFLWLACSSPSPPADVVLVVVDTLRADRLGIYGNPREVSPAMDAIGREGVWFTRAYAQSGWTLPSFVSLWTGKYPHEHKVGRQPGSYVEFGGLPESEETLAELFQRAGYSTAAVINNTFLAPEFGVQQGFGTYLYEGSDNSTLRSAELTTKAALGWLEKSKGPRFLVVHYMEPHMRLEPSAEARGRFASLDNPVLPVPFKIEHAKAMTDSGNIPPEKIAYALDLYDEEILTVDLAFQELVSGIKALGLWENTLIGITSDHGEEFWDHGEFEHGHTLRSVLTRVPLILTGPGARGIGERSMVVEHTDLFHGLLAQAGIKAPPGTHGQDLFGLARRNASEERWSLSENTLYGPPLISLVTPDHRLLMSPQTKMATVWKIDAQGRDGELVPEARQKEVGAPLLEGMKAMRGNLDALEIVSGPQIPTQQVFQQLKALGYISEEP